MSSETYAYPYSTGYGSFTGYYNYDNSDTDTTSDDSTDSELNYIDGSETSEELVGTAGDDGIGGYAGDDYLYGEDGNDQLIGVDLTVFGAGEIDYLSGGAGADGFGLGTSDQAFYIEEGADDFGIISDYSAEEGDTIFVYGTAEDYELVPLELEDGNAVGIFYQGEAIGLVADNPDLSLSTDFVFWDETSDV
ncbi:MAG: calcium-binding protein [Waterburya sp.]